MEQRKVMLSCGLIGIPPKRANVSLIVTELAVEVTTVVHFDNVPFAGPWYLNYPVNTANGRLTNCKVSTFDRCQPCVAFNAERQIVAVGPCYAPTLTFTMIMVYVPSFCQSFITHLHLGMPNAPCMTTLRIQNWLNMPLTAQVRTINGNIRAIVLADDMDADYLETTLSLSDLSNTKVNIFLHSESYFGIPDNKKFLVVKNNGEAWAFSTTQKGLPYPSVWVLKPPFRDINFIRLYASPISIVGVSHGKHELFAMAAKIICDRESFFDRVVCEQEIPEQDLTPLNTAVWGYPSFQPLSVQQHSSWRSEPKLTPHVQRILACLDI
jgi:hypothetical protein